MPLTVFSPTGAWSPPWAAGAALRLLDKQRLDKRNRRLIGPVASGLDLGFHFHGLPSVALEPLSL
jgi:hypothetical protein